jgi:hypothetical protein
MTPDELLDLLIQWWNISPSPPTHKEATKLQFRCSSTPFLSLLWWLGLLADMNVFSTAFGWC